MQKYQAQTQSDFRKWKMTSPFFNTRGEALEWIFDKRKICQTQERNFKPFKNAYISLYSEGEKVGVIEKFAFNSLGLIKPLKLKRKGA